MSLPPKMNPETGPVATNAADVAREETKVLATGDTSAHRENENADLRSRMKTGEWLMVVLTTFIVIATFGQVWVAWSSSSDTTRLVNAADSIKQSLASTVQQNADSAKKNTAAMEAQLTQMREQTAAMIRSNGLVLDSFRTEKRARIAIESIEIKVVPAPMPPGYEAMHPYWYNFQFKNFGGTAARNIKVTGKTAVGAHTLSYDEKAIASLVAPGAARPPSKDVPMVQEPIWPMVQTLGPGSATPIPFRMVGSLVQNGKDYSFLLGRVDYTDEFNTPHWLTYCYVVFGTNGSLNYCWYGNGEDKNGTVTSQR